MKKLRLLKDWSHESDQFKSGDFVEIDSGDLVVELLEKGIGELVKDAAAAVDAAPSMSAKDVDDLVDAKVKAIIGKVNRPTITVGKDAWLDDPKRGYKSPRDFFLEVLNAGKGATKISPQLSSLKVKAVGGDEQSEFADQYGGFLLPIAFQPELLKITPEADPLIGKTRSVPMSVPTIKWPARVDKNHTTSVSGGFTVRRREESEAVTASRVALEQVTLNAHTLIGAAYVTEELLSDSPISIAAMIADGFRDEMVKTILRERLYGTGVGEYMGVMNSPCLITVAAETGQTASNPILFENVVKMYAQLWNKSNGLWLANHSILPYLAQMNQSVGVAGVPAWQPNAREGSPNTLWGLPIYFTEYCKNVATTGDLILGNWAEYLEGTLQPLQSAESMHVRFVNHERVFKIWVRNAGAPWWNAALTPMNSAPQLSPFIALATRS